MATEFIKFVHDHPPRCVADLNPKPTAQFEPSIKLPSHLTVFHDLCDPQESDYYDTVSFVIGCPCGKRAVHLLGYHITTEGRRPDAFLVGPLSIECNECKLIFPFFDTRLHGYDGEQGVNTHSIGHGAPEVFRCPHCGPQPLIISASFTYVVDNEFKGVSRERPQDFFTGIVILAQCTKCNSLIEATWFECD